MRRHPTISKLAQAGLWSAACALISFGLALAVETLLRPTSPSPSHVEWWGAFSDPVITTVALPIVLACWLLGLLSAVVLLPPGPLTRWLSLIGVLTIVAVGLASLVSAFLAPLAGLGVALSVMYCVRVRYHIRASRA